MEISQLDKVVLAALLHDVGKFAQRAEVPLSRTTRQMENLICKSYQGRYTHKHVLWTSEFFELFGEHSILGMAPEKDSIANLAMYHHNPETKLQELIRLADWLSSGTDRHESEDEEAGKDREQYKKARMHVIFDYLKLDELGNEKPQSRYELDPLDNDAENVFPTRVDRLNPAEGEKLVHAYSELWEAFCYDLAKLGARSAHRLTVSLLGLLEKYTWSIPSSTMHRPDISLFDHAKTTAAIAAVLFRYHTDPARDDLETASFSMGAEDHRFKLLVGDLSGIQDYIFNITNVGVGGTAKRLRARSFFLSVLTEIASQRILRAFDLPLTNLVIASGGKFYLLLPNTTGADDIVSGLKLEFDRWCMAEMNGEIALNLATEDFSCADFLAFNQVLRRVNDRLQQAKAMPFATHLTGDGRWHVGRFVVDHRPFAEGEKLCDCCERHPGREREGVVTCPSCDQDVNLGTDLSRASGIQYFADNSGKYKALGGSFSLLRPGFEPAGAAWLVQPFNDWSFPGHDAPLKPRFFANHIPLFAEDSCCYCEAGDCKDRGYVQSGFPKFFNCLAEASRGRKLLGVFKADVDNLGLIFINGFQSEQERSISRITTLSRQLDVFFTGRVDYLLRHEFQDIYTVYAGGDDLLVLGPWSMTLRFAQRLRDEFADFTSHNPAFSLSAGIALVKPRLPIYVAIETADELLDTAKDRAALGETGGKDQVAIFGDHCKWEKLAPLHAEGDQLAGWLTEHRVSMGFVRQLLDAGKAYQQFAKTGDTRLLRFVPMLAYSINRNIPGKETEIINWAHDLTDIKGSRNLKNLTFISNYAITANR